MSQYKAYPTYKDSGIEWIGKVPEHWEIKPFFALVSELNRKNTGLIETNILSLSYGQVIKKPEKRNMGLTPRSYETYQIVEPGEIVFRFTDLQNDKRSLRSAEVMQKGIITSAYMAVKPCGVESSYFAWLMRSYDLSKVFYAMGGGLRQSLKFEDVRRLPVLIPSPEEQAIIKATLDRETFRIDALIQKKTRFIGLLKEKVIAIAMAEQMHGNGECIRLKHLVQVIARPVNLVDDGEYVALGLYNRGRGLFHKPLTLGKDIGDSDFFYVEPGDLILSGQFAWEGAVTMASSSESGCIVSHRYPIVRGKKVTTEYLLALFMTNFGDFLLNESSRGSAGRNRPLNINLLLNEKVRMPSIKAQEDIKRLIELKGQLENKVQVSIEQLKEHRTAFVIAAATGQIDLRGK